LFGTSENGEDVVYIGQAHIKKNGNGMLGRIFELHPTIILDQQKLVISKIDFVCVK